MVSLPIKPKKSVKTLYSGIATSYKRLDSFVERQTERIGLTADLILVLLIGFLVRIAAWLVPRDFWHDEAFQYLLSKESVPFIVNSPDVHPPLFNLITKLFISVGITEPLALRFIMVLFSVVGLFFFFKLVKEWFNSRAALYGSLFLALSPTFIYYSIEFRSYSFVLTVAIIQLLYFNRLLRGTAGPTTWVVTSAIMVWSHYLASLILFVQIIILSIRGKLLQNIKALSFFTLAILPVAVYLFRTLPKIQSFWFDNIDFVSLISTAWYLVVQPTSDMVWFPVVLYFPLVVGTLYFRKSFPHGLYELLAYICIPVLTMWIISQYIPFYHHRYFLFGGVLLYAWIGWLCDKIDTKWPEHAMAWLGFVMALLIFSNAKGHLFDYDDDLVKSMRFMSNQTNNRTDVDTIIIHTSTFSQSPYKVFFPHATNYLLTNLTREIRFTGGGSVIKDYEIIHSVINVSEDAYYISDRPIGNEYLFIEGGLWITQQNDNKKRVEIK